MGLNQESRSIPAPDNAARLSWETPLDDEPVRETIHQNQIPAFVPATLERLYGNIYCTIARIAAYESLSGVSTYVRRRDARIETLILFREQGHVVSVVNQQIALCEEEVLAFCETIFSRYPKAGVIKFYALDLQLKAFPLLHQQIGVLEENIIFLPPGKKNYLDLLKGQFRKQLLAAGQAIRRDYPGYRVELLSRGDIKADTVEALLALAETRMRAKGKATYTSKTDAGMLTKLLRNYGHLAIAKIDDELCAGAMWFGVGKRHFHQISACDPKYDQYMLGNQIWLAAIQYSLDLQGEECWLMGGSSAHKARFRAERRVFNSITVYRSGLHAFFNCREYAQCWTSQQAAKLKIVLKAKSASSGVTGRCIGKALAVTRTVRAHLRQRRR